jgi:hypothetical protein
MNEIEWNCGFYDEFHQLLYDGEISLDEVIKAYKQNKITPYQYKFAIDYLTIKE